MTMTKTEAKALALVSIDPKALEHACLSAGRSVHHFDRMGDDLPLRSSIVAHARAIEREAATEARHAAELRELKERFSEAVCEWRDADTPVKAAKAAARLHDFILPAPDPLVEAEKLISTLRSDEREGYAVAGQAAETISNLVAALRAHQKDTNA